MKKVYSLLLFGFVFSSACAQITITDVDMPVIGDTLRYSFTANGNSGITLSNTGTNMNWDFSSLVAVGQRVDTYKSAIQVNPIYTLISPTAYGYKVADSFPGLSSFLPISIKGIHTFYNKKPTISPTRFIAEGFAATIAGIPTPAVYQDEDEIYFFPLAYSTTNDSSTFRLSFNLSSLGSMLQKGYRKTTVDGWGTIVTPFYSTPLNCIRVRSELHEVDSITISPLPAIGIPRNTVEYKWLANGEHYPALWVTASLTGTTETITSVRYRDKYRPGLLSIASASNTIQPLKGYPNPTQDGIINFSIPQNWKQYNITVYDIHGKLILSVSNTTQIDLSKQGKGNYLAVINYNGENSYLVLSY